MMRKKELRTRNDQLRRELSHAHQVAASHVKQINEHRMQLAMLQLERPPIGAGIGTGDGASVPDTPEYGARCPTCGHLAAGVVTSEPVMKACPDCAEPVRLAARRCRYCGYLFGGIDQPRNGNGSKDAPPNGSTPITRLGSVSGS
jgi:Uncharacterised protein family UPF0547